MDEQVLDASAIDNLNDYELTGEPEDFIRKKNHSQKKILNSLQMMKN